MDYSHYKIFEGFNTLPTAKNNQFGFNFRHTELYGSVYINKFTATSSVDQIFNKSTRNKLWSSFIHHINGDRFFFESL